MWDFSRGLNLTLQNQVSRSSGYGPLHEILMNLSAKTIYTGRWGAVVAPSNETELMESRTARKSERLMGLLLL